MLRFVSVGVVAGIDGGRPTSRGLPPAKARRWATLPCPAGARGAASVRKRRCLPLRGKSASELARLILVCRGRELFAGRFAHQERLAGAPGERKHAVLRSMRPPRSRNHPAGRTAGSARTRSRDSSLENPFLGERQPFSRGSTPPNAAGGKPLLVGLPPSIPSTAPFGPKRSTPAPFVTGRVCVYLRPKALAAGTAGNGGG